MGTLAEIEAAIASLPMVERDRLESRLIARRFGGAAQLEDELCAAIAEADEDPHGGKSPEEVRSLIRQWASASSSEKGR